MNLIQKLKEEHANFKRESPNVKIPYDYFCIGKGAIKGLFNPKGANCYRYNIDTGGFSECWNIAGGSVHDYYFVRVGDEAWNTWIKNECGKKGDREVSNTFLVGRGSEELSEFQQKFDCDSYFLWARGDRVNSYVYFMEDCEENYALKNEHKEIFQQYLEEQLNIMQKPKEITKDSTIRELLEKVKLINQKINENDGEYRGEKYGSIEKARCELVFSAEGRSRSVGVEFDEGKGFMLIISNNNQSLPFEESYLNKSKTTTSFKVNGYTGEYNPQNKTWKFGCAEIAASTIANCNTFLGCSVSDPQKGKGVTEIKVGEGSFTKANTEEMVKIQRESQNAK